MASFYKDLIEMLKAGGCYFVREGRGDHEVWFSPITNRNFLVDHGTRSRHTANESLKQAGLPKAF